MAKITRSTESTIKDLEIHKERTERMEKQAEQEKQQAKAVDTFLKFAYCFPLDLKERFIEYYGQSMGKHFWGKYKGFCKTKSNTFIALIYTYGDMTTGNQQLFMQLINDYYKES